jgi:hypothetical protein
MCNLCRADGNYFHTPECVYDQLVSEYPVMWLRDSTRIGACYTLRERHCCKVSDEAAFCLIQRPYISKTLLTRRISPRGSP